MLIRRRSLLATAGAATWLQGQDRVRGGIIGSGNRGRYLMAEFKEIGVEMAAVADIYEPNLQAGLKIANTGAKGFDNYKRLLDDKSIEVVIVASPDHWHAQMVIDAVDAGKDVYVEKPLAHTIEEGYRMIDAVKRTKRIVQVGTQRRSFDLFLDAKKIFDSGACGSVKLVNSWWYNNTSSFSNRQFTGKLDAKQWLGTAPQKEVTAERFFNWYWYFDYSGGLMVGQAAHVVDAIQWFMGSKYPLAVTCTGMKPNIAGAEVPETCTLTAEFPDYFAVFTLGYQSMRYPGVTDQMKQFNGNKARFDVGRESYALYKEDPKSTEAIADPYVRRPGSFSKAAPQHIRNFLECVRSRKEPNAPVEAAQATNIVLCLAMDSLRQGKRLEFKPRA